MYGYTTGYDINTSIHTPNYIPTGGIRLRLGDELIAIPEGSDILRLVSEVEYSFHRQMSKMKERMFVFASSSSSINLVGTKTIEEDKEKQKLKDLIAHYYSKG